jgi:4-hydroxy-tetrahydrodipicolinate reductase
MKLALLGYGRMGHEVEAAAKAAGHEVVTVIDDAAEVTRGELAEADVAIDFTTPESAIPNIERCCEAGLPLVMGTTGWYARMDDAKAIVAKSNAGFVWAPNFSLGVQLFLRLAERAGRLVDTLDEYDVGVHEVHHRHKVDHPSGTAIRIAEALASNIARKQKWEAGPPEGKPDPSVLWVGSSRVGEVPGTHHIWIEGPDDTIELRHTARGRGGFARGAVTAAEWIRGRKGFYSIDDLLAERFGG